MDFSGKASILSTFEKDHSTQPRGVMVAQEVLVLSVGVQIPAGLPALLPIPDIWNLTIYLSPKFDILEIQAVEHIADTAETGTAFILEVTFTFSFFRQFLHSLIGNKRVLLALLFFDLDHNL